MNRIRTFPGIMKLLRPVLALLLLCAAVTVLVRQLSNISLNAVLSDVQSMAPISIAGALGLVILSFTTGGLYEGLMLRAIGKPLGMLRPMIVAIVANSIGHCLGWSTLTGGALRWRLYASAGIERMHIGLLLLLSALPFTFGIWLLLAFALLVSAETLSPQLHLSPLSLRFIAGGALVLLASGLVLLVRTGPTKWARWRITLPTSTLLAAQMCVGIIEIVLVASALYILLPTQPHLSFVQFLLTYLIAVLLGQLSSVPAGLGVLEASLILLLPQFPASQLIASVAIYRLIFEVLPLSVGLLLLTTHETLSRHGYLGKRWRKIVPLKSPYRGRPAPDA